MRFEARTSREAVRLALQMAQRALSCVSDTVLILTEPEPGQHVISTGRTREAAISDGYRLAVFEEYRPLSSRAPVAFERTAYRHRIVRRDRELVAYHWNPNGPEGKSYPHLHLGAAAEVGNRALTRAHIPTGEVSLADVVRLLIEELGVRARRADWRRVLGETVG